MLQTKSKSMLGTLGRPEPSSRRTSGPIRAPKRKKSDPWLSPREAAELLLDHKTFPRTIVQIRTLAKQICTACAEHMADLERPVRKRTGAGIVCDRIGRAYRLQLSELERWCRRRSEKGQAYLKAVAG